MSKRRRTRRRAQRPAAEAPQPRSRAKALEGIARSAVAAVAVLAAGAIIAPSAALIASGLDPAVYGLPGQALALAMLALPGDRQPLVRRMQRIIGVAGTLGMLAAAVASAVSSGFWWYLPMPLIGAAYLGILGWHASDGTTLRRVLSTRTRREAAA